MGIVDPGGGIEKDAGVMVGRIHMEVPDDFFGRAVEVAMDEGKEPEARDENQPSLGALEYGDHPQTALRGRFRYPIRRAIPNAAAPRFHHVTGCLTGYPFASRPGMRTMKKTAARKTAIPAYCPGVSPKYLASPMRRKSRKKRAGT